MKFTLIFSLLISALSFAYISEEIDDLKSFACKGELFDVKYNGKTVKGTGKNLRGDMVNLSGELISVTIDTATRTIGSLIKLENTGSLGFRYMTLDSTSGNALLTLHYDMTRVAGTLNYGTCKFVWK